jgi:hypothetical protein
MMKQKVIFLIVLIRVLLLRNRFRSTLLIARLLIINIIFDIRSKTKSAMVVKSESNLDEMAPYIYRPIRITLIVKEL